jgi:hypothetical protein
MRPETFFDCLGEKKLAGYLHFLSMSDFHICAISWPLLRATVAIRLHHPQAQQRTGAWSNPWCRAHWRLGSNRQRLVPTHF